MPPNARTTREMIVEAAFAVAREEGVERVSARTVSERLGCSTQPVMYHFATIEELKRAAYARADRFHSEYLMAIRDPREGVPLGIGLNYIRFGLEEPHLFRFLFQSGFAVERSVLEMVNSEELRPILSAMGEAMGMDQARTREVFLTLALFTHGYASILANNSLAYDEETVAADLERAYRGAVLAAQEENR